MNDTPFKVYGFNYECNGKKYAFDVLDASEESAKRRVSAMSKAVFDGELKQGTLASQSAMAAISSSDQT